MIRLFEQGSSVYYISVISRVYYTSVTLRKLVFISLGTKMGVRIRGTPGDIDPLNKVPFTRVTSSVQKGPPLRGPPNAT